MDRGGVGMGGSNAEEEGTRGRSKTGNTDIGNYIHRLMLISCGCWGPKLRSSYLASKQSTN